MVNALIDAFRTRDLRNKLLFTLAMLVVFRFLAHVPLPGVDQDRLQAVMNDNALLNLLDLFSGGGLAKLSVVALGVNPYINASIIMTLLQQTIPALERLSKEGEYGRNKINSYTRILTIPLALMQGIGVSVFMQRSGVISEFGVSNLGLTIAILSTLTAGTLILMWLGELISERGIGNGISFIIFAGIVGRLPQTVAQTIEVQSNYVALAFYGLIGLGVIAAIIFIQEGQRRIPVQYAKRVRGTRMYSGGSTHIPLRVNSAGVIPIIFAISILLLPSQIAQYFVNSETEWLAGASQNIVAAFQNPFLYNSLYFLLVVAFTFFYTAFTFIPNDVADNIKRYGGFIPGIRPGRPTAEFLGRVVTRITITGAL
ncbi:MAG: preprotein translocase subunit SecY, partial [Candidatus Limnocylindria bacterium]|nr:preprotein translocase subunit SecY [Candidatus Limnocylindria bacterium]